MILLFCIIGSFVISFAYIYFTQLIYDNLIWWHIPLSLIVSFLIMIILVIIILAIFSLTYNKKKEVKKLNKFYHFIIKHVAMFLITIFRIDLKLENWNMIPKNGNYVMVSNHQGNFDPIIAAWVFSRDKPTFIMKNNILKLPIVGRILMAAGFLPIDRDNDRKSMQSIITAIKRVEDGGNICIYPEGTRSKGANLLTFRNGAFKIPQKSKSPIVVVAIDGMYKIKKNFPFKKSKVLFRICEVIEYDVHKEMHTNELSDYVKNIIENNLSSARDKYKWLN